MFTTRFLYGSFSVIVLALGITIVAPVKATEVILIDFAGDGPNSSGVAPAPWISINNLVQDEAFDLGGGVTITALDDGFNPNNTASPGTGTMINEFLVPQEAFDDYLFKIADTAGTEARMRIDGLMAGNYDVSVFEGRSTDVNQVAKIWVGDEPADENTGNFAGSSSTVNVTLSAGDSLWYKHLEDGSGGISGMIINPIPEPSTFLTCALALGVVFGIKRTQIHQRRE